MDTINYEQKYYESLELPKVLKMLAEECTGEKAKRAALALQPQTDLFTVKREVAKASAALDMSVRYGSPMFYGLDGSGQALKRCGQGAVLSLAELIAIRKLLTQVNSLSDWWNKCEVQRPELEYLFDSLFPDKYLEHRLDVSIIDENELADEASSELASIRRKIAACGQKIRDTLEKMIKSPTVGKYLQETIVTVRDGRYVLPVRSEFKGQVQGFVHDTSSTGNTLFIEPAAVVEANNDIKILEGKEQEEIERIIKAFSSDCAAIKEQLVSSYDAVCELDLYFAKADLAAKMHAFEPEISDDRVIVLNKARHPLIDKDKIVPVSVSLGIDYETLIITGPNTGGKTVLLKTVGLLTLMTMCGMLIPVSDGSRISVFDHILVNIGDMQSIEMDLSTFSAHMSGVVRILEQADGASLVLLDELGSGTDPVEGAALAVSIIEQLRKQGASTITTTHYQELKMYALDTPRIENAACEFDVETMSPTYRLIIGAPGKSNAFAISKRLGVPEYIIDHAKSLVSDEDRKFEEILERLEAARIELERNNAEAEKYRAEAEKLRSELAEERRQLAERKEAELEKARREAGAIVKRVEKQSQELIDELDELRKQKEQANFTNKAIDARHKQKNAVNKMYLEANPVSKKEDNYVLPRPLKKGDRVMLADSGRTGVVSAEPDSRGICYVQIGAMRTKVDVKKLRLDENGQPLSNRARKKAYGHVSHTGVESRATRKVSREVDIRGCTCDEGIYEVDSFIDQAVLSGVSVVTVIHGVGTGVLKNAVRAHLRSHPNVKSSRKGMFGEGEDGVTIVELK
ncbi:MAG: endonuclease MutS2 [Ruminococcus sp.]|nr:endonuclease MutS2 [Ruminococcus sp.]